jgi:chorismate synthase
MTTPRPGHADLTGALKYGYGDLRVALERASARETAVRVAIGAIAKRLLSGFGITVGGYVTEIGGERAAFADDPPDYLARFAATEQSEVRCPDPGASARIEAAIRQAKIDKDTLGGVIEVIALGLPPGLGSHVHYDRRLTGRLVAAVCSVQSIKGAEIGPAFENARKRGTQVHDGIYLEDGSLRRRTNRAGGLEGGMTTGEPLIVRAAMKPISTTLTPLESVDLASGQPAPTKYERSDFCATPRAVVVIEAMVAFVLADELLRKLGGDSLDELRPRFAALRRGELSDLRMDGAPWRFGYEAWE